VIYLDNLNYPYAYSWIQLLRQRIKDLKEEQEAMQQIGGMTMQQQGQQPGALPPPGDQAGLEALATEAGVPLEELMAALEG